MTLRVKNWNEKYEVNRTRELKRPRWVPVRNDLANLGYAKLVTHPNGPAQFGCWIAILELASKCEKRGTLVKHGVPYTLEDIALVTRMPIELVQETVARLTEQTIGWLEDTDVSEKSAEIPQHGAESERSIRQGKARQGKAAAAAGKPTAVPKATAPPVPAAGRKPPHTEHEPPPPLFRGPEFEEARNMLAQYSEKKNLGWGAPPDAIVQRVLDPLRGDPAALDVLQEILHGYLRRSKSIKGWGFFPHAVREDYEARLNNAQYRAAATS